MRHTIKMIMERDMIATNICHHASMMMKRDTIPDDLQQLFIGLAVFV